MSSQPPETLEKLWHTLGLDSLPADAGSAENLGGTRVPDWDEVTLRHAPVASAPAKQRGDLARLSMKPPLGDVPAAEPRRQAGCGGGCTTRPKNRSMQRTTAVSPSMSVGFVTYALACSW